MELNSTKDTKKLSKRISEIIQEEDVIFLYGEIGVGKTTFVRYLINHLEESNGIEKSEILSPTFNIVYNYDIKKVKILHYDLYRIKNHNDILELGIFEASKNYIKLIEWPELIKLKPQDRIEMKFKYLKKKDSRSVKIMGLGKCKKYKFNDI